MIGALDCGRCDDERVGKPQGAVLGPQACRVRGDVCIELDDLDRQPLTEVMNEADGLIPAAGGPDEALSNRGRGDREPVSSIEGFGNNPPGGRVVRVVTVEQPDEDAGVEVD